MRNLELILTWLAATIINSFAEFSVFVIITTTMKLFSRTKATIIAFFVFVRRHYALGILLWLGICGGLVFAFLSQWYNFFNGLKLWWYVAGGYTGYAALHAVLSQRDGYCVSINQSIANFLRSCYLGPIAYIFELAAYMSARGPNEHFLMPYKMKTGWGPFFSNMIFWIFVIGAKGVFDWFAVMATMKDSVLALMNAGWLGGTEIIEDIEYNDDPEIPPIITYRTEQKFDIDIILVIGRVLPGFIVMMNNMQVKST